MRKFNIAVILAGGVGTRFGAYDVPKQFVRLAGKPILAYSLESFINNPRINGVIVVAKKEYHDLVKNIVENLTSHQGGKPRAETLKPAKQSDAGGGPNKSRDSRDLGQALEKRFSAKGFALGENQINGGGGINSPQTLPKKLLGIIEGGSERYLSTIAALRYIEGLDLAGKGQVQLLIHDAARPLLSPRIIKDMCIKLEHFSAVDTVLPAVDTIIAADFEDALEKGAKEGDTRGHKGERIIADIPDRGRLFYGQTPQGFHLEVLSLAYKKALATGTLTSSDDCYVVRNFTDAKIALVMGEDCNLKLTYPNDLHILDKLLSMQGLGVKMPSSDTKSPMAGGLGKPLENATLATLKSKLAGKNIAIFGAGSGIGKSILEVCDEIGVLASGFSKSSGCDITNSEDIKAALEIASRPKTGAPKGIDAVIITAGSLIVKPLLEMSKDEIENNIALNITAAIEMARASMPYLMPARGVLIFFTSSSYTRGRAGYALYSASKAAIANLVNALGEEVYEAGVRVNAICPSRTDTPMRRAAFGKEDKNTLLSAREVAIATLEVVASDMTCAIVDVRRETVT